MQIVRLWVALTFGLAMAGPEAHACPVHDGHHAAAPVEHHHSGSHDDDTDADPLCTCPQESCPVGVSVALLPGWVYPGCPHTGPGVTVDGRGTSHVVWFTGKADDPGLYYARRAGDSAGFTTPVQVIAGRITAHPRVAALPDGDTSRVRVVRVHPQPPAPRP